jgi:hypothetical protein
MKKRKWKKIHIAEKLRNSDLIKRLSRHCPIEPEENGENALIFMILADSKKKTQDTFTIFCDKSGKIDAEECLKHIVWAWLLGLDNDKYKRGTKEFRDFFQNGGK